MFRNVVLSKRELVVSCDSSVRVYSLASGETVRWYTAHDGRVTCMQLAPSNSTQLYSCSPSDNLLKWWDYSDGKLLDSWRNSQSGWNLLRFTALKDGKFFALVALNSKYPKIENDWKVVELQLQNKAEGEKKLNFGRVLMKSKGFRCAGLTSGGPNARHVAIISSCTLLWFDAKLNESSKRVHSRPLTALAIHPTQECVATGDVEGKVVLWRRNTCSILHWHAHPVSVTYFTSDGLYLLSGGSEAVLVLWQLETSKKTFLPRLGAPLKELSTNNDSSKYAVRTEANVVIAIDAPSLHIDFKLNGMAFKTFPGSGHAHGLIVDPKSGNMVIPRGGFVHFYSVEDRRTSQTVDICKRNYVSPTEKESMKVAVVEAVAVSSSWLATVERRNSEVTLKFWARERNSNFDLVSVFTRAHLGRVNAMNFHPCGNSLVTGAEDGQFKLWELKSLRSGWFCRSVAFHKMLPVKDCKFSHDGSTLGIAEATSVSLWEPETTTLLERLSTTHFSKGVSQLEFHGKYSLVVVMKGYGLHVWDLRRLTMTWSLKLPVSCIASQSQNLAVAVWKNVFFFTEESPVPKKSYELPDFAEELAFSPKSAKLFYKAEDGSVGLATEVETEFESVSTKHDARSRVGSMTHSAVSAGEKEGHLQLLPSKPVSSDKDLLRSLALYSSHLLPSVRSISDALSATAREERSGLLDHGTKRKRIATNALHEYGAARAQKSAGDLQHRTTASDVDVTVEAKKSLVTFFKEVFA